MSNPTPVTVLLIEDSPDYAELVQAWLAPSTASKGFKLDWTDSLAGALKRLEGGPVDVILLDLGLPDSEGPDTLARIRESATGVPVIVLSAGDSESQAIEMIRQGAEDYLVKSSCNAEILIRGLQYALVRHDSKQVRANGNDGARIVGVTGAKGGVGTTTFAWTLAADLHLQTSETVLLADLDEHNGLACFLAGAEPQHTAKDAAENLKRMDSSIWQRVVTQTTAGADVLASPRFLGTERLDPSAVADVIDRVRGFYSYIVLDLGRITPESLRWSSLATEMLMVTTTAIPALYAAKRSINALVSSGTEQANLRLVVNNLDGSEQLSRDDLSSAFGTAVIGVLPFDRGELHKSAMNRKLPAETSGFRRETINMARQIAGLERLKPKRAMLPMFSLGRKAR